MKQRLIGTVLLALLLLAPYIAWWHNARAYTTTRADTGREILGNLRVVKTPAGFLVPRPPSIGLVRELVAHGYEPYTLSSIIVFRRLPGEVSRGILRGECCEGWGSDPRLAILMVNAYYQRVYGRPLGTSTPLLLVVYPNNSLGVILAGGDNYSYIAGLMERLKTWYTAGGGVLVVVNPMTARFDNGTLLELGSSVQWRLLWGPGNGRVLVLLLAGDPDRVDLRVYQALLGFPVSREEVESITGVFFHKGSVVVVDGSSGIIEALRTYG